MNTISKLLMLFFHQSKLKIARSMMYRFDFIIGITIALAFNSIGPILQYLIFTQTEGFPGWTLEEIILFQGVLLLALGIRVLLFGDLHGFVLDLVRDGDLDRFLIKPAPALGIIIGSGFSLNGIGSIFAGMAIIVYSVHSLELVITIVQIALFLLTLMFGVILYLGLEVLYICSVIILINIGRLDDILQSITRFGEYPLSIFAPVTKIVLITIVPFAIWANYPAEILIRGWENIIMVCMACCTLFLIGSLYLWKICIKRYTSAGG